MSIGRKPIHGMEGSRIYHIYQNMKSRCNNPKKDNYHHYGGRGVTVCKEWNQFVQFFKDMGPSYSEQLQLDRIDNNKGYSKENCRWVTPKQNSNNRKNTPHLTLRGVEKTLSEWCDLLGYPHAAIYRRLHYYGWDVEKALDTPVNKWIKKQL